VAHEEALAGAERQGPLAQHDLLSAPENQAQHRFVQRRLEGAGGVLSNERETLQGLHELARFAPRKVARGKLGEFVEVHGCWGPAS
jgi:hypothetical protein